MEIRELAERVLFSPTLAEKLLPPGLLTDDRPGKALALPTGPARPPGLGLHEIRGRQPFPARLEREADRAAVLHAFANHELLALELMALVLLRFPDAPPAFRRGLARILGEEATHFGLYTARMAAVGVEFGALPVNRFLWDSLVGVTGVEDYAARMSLTFEAANLDYTLMWARRFRAVGDEDTAVALDQVYADEVGHVRHGLHWFRRELPDDADLWTAYTAALPRPLTPARAKGEVFSAEARRAAGLDEAFIAAISLYQHSKGRPPVVHLFNPDAEAQVARPGLEPSGAAAALATDLDLLPVFLAAPDDVVVVRRAPDPSFLRALSDAGFALPQIEVVPDLSRLGESDLATRKLGGLDPWGWSPRSAAWLAPLRPALVGEAPDWNPGWRPLYSKPWAAKRLAELLVQCQRGLDWLPTSPPHPAFGHLLPQGEGESPSPPLLPSGEGGPTGRVRGRAIGQISCDSVLTASEDAAKADAPIGRRVGDLATLTQAQTDLFNAGYPQVVVKAPFGTAGRGALRLTGPPTPAQSAALTALWAAEGPGVVEPWLDRVLDLSFHLDVLPDRSVRYRGVHRFFTSAQGRYLGSWLGPFFHDLPADLARFLTGDGKVDRWLDRQGRAAARAVGEAAAALGYTGPLGIDALVYRGPEGYRLRPIVEVNPRITMGRLAMALAPKVAARRAGIWSVLTSGDVKKAGFSGLAAWAAARPPAVWGADGRLLDGVVFTTDPHAATFFASALSAGPDAATSWGALGLPVPGR